MKTHNYWLPVGHLPVFFQEFFWSDDLYPLELFQFQEMFVISYNEISIRFERTFDDFVIFMVLFDCPDRALWFDERAHPDDFQHRTSDRKVFFLLLGDNLIALKNPRILV